MQFVKQSKKSVALFAARFLPRRVKAALYPIRARLLGRGLSRGRVFEPSAEWRAASASMSIIVPIHDAPWVTKRCLASLERDATKSEIILVDDGSKLTETTEVIQRFSGRNGWKVARSEEPRGHSEACAAGARLATRPYLCLLNSDTVVTPWCWRAIQEVFDTDSSVGIAGPCTSSSGNEQTLDIASKCCLYWNDSQICAFAERLTIAPLQPPTFELPWIGGFALFIRRSLWETVGGFDRNLKNYLNDVELCKRVTNLGYRAVWVRSAYIHHLGNQSHPRIASRTEVQSALSPYLQYIHDKHKWHPHVNATYTTIVRSKDGKAWVVRSDQSVANV
jgi:GT2 family glycosyltransferase